ncbi:MAG: 3-dehydroquinate synthase [Nitrospirales bacterium]|nr:MAG: 3-dehydroquinate synthase [Nitrospirales bacterium]
MKNSDLSKHVLVSLGDRSYQVLIQPQILPQIGRVLQDVGLSGRVAIVTNPVVNELYGRVVVRALKRCGFSPFLVVIPDGEKAKSMYWLSKILDELVTQRLERQEVVLALGGGVVGDVAGFAASVYLRGVSFVQVPTTLVAQVDSSVGGKTGVNHPIGKNLIGAFYQPRVVVVDPQTLQSLPKREWVAGLAEVIKYGMIADSKFFEYLEQHVDDLREQAEDVIPTVIRRCCEIKAEVVGGDERESGRRRILNYGHTVGHALETWGRYKTWIHGEAVGIGMVQEAGIARFLGMCTKELVERQRDLIQDVGLPIAMPSMSFAELWGAMQHDKKVVKGQINCVVPTAIGKVQVVPLFQQRIRQWFIANQAFRVKRLDPVRQGVGRPRLSKKK